MPGGCLLGAGRAILKDYHPPWSSCLCLQIKIAQPICLMILIINWLDCKLGNITWNTVTKTQPFIVKDICMLGYCVSYLMANPSSTEPSSFNSSDVWSKMPPMRYTPDAVAQDTWPALHSLKLCDGFQTPFVHLLQYLNWGSLSQLPQTKSPSWVWPYRLNNKLGKMQLVLESGR